ncbi:MAG: sulfotransferase family 2 domain-containing protein [Pseudomonadota bacterium]
MIVSDAHRFVFIHVPKCAGTTVRGALADYHDQPKIFWGHEEVEPLGRIDLAHLTQAELRAAFPEMAERVERYAAFAVARDPMDRFLSAVGQRMAHLHKRDLVFADPAELRGAAQDVIDRLAAGESTAPPDMTFFKRQVDFMRLDGKTLVETVVPLERLDMLEDALAELLPTRPSFTCKQNVRIDPERRAPGPGPADRIAPGLARAVRRVLPRGLRRRAAAALWPRGHDAVRLLMRDGGIRSFVQSHFAADFDLYAEACKAAMSRPRRPDPGEG